MLSKFWAVPFLFPLSQIVLNQIPLRGCKEEEGQELPGFCIQRHFKEEPPLRQKCQTRAQIQETLKIETCDGQRIGMARAKMQSCALNALALIGALSKHGLLQ